MVLIADPKIPRSIGVKVVGANIGELVILRNLTQGQTLAKQIAGSDRNVVFQPADSDYQWNYGDVVQAEIHGRLQGAARVTLNIGLNTINLSASTDTSTASVKL